MKLNLTQISYLLHYSSVAHLSTQFKKVTGLSPSFFKQLKLKRKEILENITNFEKTPSDSAAADHS
jgi:AraC-like DNA-binding protein